MRTSGSKTASGVIMAGPGRWFGTVVTPDGSNDVTVTMYDNASAGSGTKLAPSMTFAGDGGTQALQPPIEPVDCINGIYVTATVAGGGTVEFVTYYECGTS
jgi:hypothetical protein